MKKYLSYALSGLLLLHLGTTVVASKKTSNRLGLITLAMATNVMALYCGYNACQGFEKAAELNNEVGNLVVQTAKIYPAATLCVPAHLLPSLYKIALYRSCADDVYSASVSQACLALAYWCISMTFGLHILE